MFVSDNVFWLQRGNDLTLIGWNSQAKPCTRCLTYITSFNPYSNPRERQQKPFVHSSMNNIESTVRSRSALACHMLGMQGQIRKRVSVLMERVCSLRKPQILKQIIVSTPRAVKLTGTQCYPCAVQTLSLCSQLPGALLILLLAFLGDSLK